MLNLGLSDGGIPDEAITASGEEEGNITYLFFNSFFQYEMVSEVSDELLEL